MSETKVICSVVIFTLGIYSVLLLQYELFKLNQLNTAGENHHKHAHPYGCSNNKTAKTEFRLERVNCGSAGDLTKLTVQSCSHLPCEILPTVNYSVELSFQPSRNITTLEIQTSVRQRKDFKYLHKEIVHTYSNEGDNTTLKFSFLFPSHPVFKSPKKFKKCASHSYLLGVEIWDVPSGIGEVCLIVPIDVQYN